MMVRIKFIPLAGQNGPAAAGGASCGASGLTGPVIRSERSGPMTPISIVNWFAAAYRALGLNGCSSHSGGGRSLREQLAWCTEPGGGLRDVQLLAGHPYIHTTQPYIDGDTDAQRRLVS